MITYIHIYRKSAKTWYILDDEHPTEDLALAENRYTGRADGNYISIKTMNGARIYDNQPYNIFTYTDEVDSENDFTPESAVDLIDKLNAFGFFYDGVSEGGGVAATSFLELTDTFSSYIGRNMQLLIVNGLGIATTTLNSIFSILNIAEWGGGSSLLPNKYLATNNEGTQIVQLDIDTIINYPVPYGTMRPTKKGAVWNGTDWVINGELYLPQAGDTFEGMKIDDVSGRLYSYPDTVWNGEGDVNDIANHDWAFRIPQLNTL